jgi:hypothetical protein
VVMVGSAKRATARSEDTVVFLDTDIVLDGCQCG